MSYVAIWLQACLHWRYAYFQALSWNDTIFVVDWDILYKLCGSANKWSKGFIFSGKIWWQLLSCNKACSKYHTGGTTTPKYTHPQRLVHVLFCRCEKGLLNFLSEIMKLVNRINNTRLAFQTFKTTSYRLQTSELRCFDTVFQRPYRYFSIALKVVFPCPIAKKFSPVVGYGLKFVKMQF